MKHIISKTLLAAVVMVGLFAGAGSAEARGGRGGSGGGSSATDVAISIDAPTTVNVSAPATYTVSVTNVSRNKAQGVKARVVFPLTHTSPTAYILGELSGIDSRCTVVNNALECNLGTLNKNASVSFTFDHTAVVSTQTLVFDASVSTTNTDSNSNNDIDSVTPTIQYPTRVFGAGIVTNDHCTGTDLTSYYECEVSPTSVTSHDVTFNANGTISSNNGVTGMWSHPSATELYFHYVVNNAVVAIFSGRAINGQNCFDGITVFPQNNSYNSAYRVCQ